MGVKGAAATPAPPLVVPDAASLSANGFSASVVVSGVPAEVFASESKDNAHSGFIISNLGASFTVEVRDLRPTGPAPDIAATLFCDGEKMVGFASDSGRRGIMNFVGKRVSATAISPFLFSNIELSDDAAVCNADPNLIQNLGTITLKICRITVKSLPSATSSSYYDPAVSKTINERTKKGMMSHTTGLGASTYAPPVATVQADWIDNANTPWITFTFKYRSRQLLELQSIIAEEEVPVQVEPEVVGKGKKRQVITIDESDDEFTMKKIKPEKRVKAEPGLKPEKGIKKEKQIIVLSDSE